MPYRGGWTAGILFKRGGLTRRPPMALRGSPEHVAFMRPSWFYWATSRIGCQVGSIRRLRYQPLSWRKRLDEGLKNLSYITYHQLQRAPFLSTLLSHIPFVRRVGK